jgi:F-type H+-transporting ATPase subunit delta
MADFTFIARPYAKAAFEFAKSANALAVWSSQLSTLAAVIQDPAVANLLGSPKAGQMAVAEAILSGLAGKLDRHVGNFIRLLADMNRMKALPAISQSFETLLLAENKMVDATVTSVSPVDEDSQRKIAAALEKRLGRQVKLHCEIDKSLIGGVIIRAEDWVLDGSLRGKLTRLSQELMEG